MKDHLLSSDLIGRSNCFSRASVMLLATRFAISTNKRLGLAFAEGKGMLFFGVVTVNLMRCFALLRGVAVRLAPETMHDADKDLYTTGHPINANSNLGT